MDATWIAKALISAIPFCVFLHVGICAAQTNENPTVEITHPLQSFSYTTLSIVRFEASASDPDGSVTNVQFLVNTNLIGSVSPAPFTLWTTNEFDLGFYQVQAVAFDDQGASNVSPVISFSVVLDLWPIAQITFPTNGEVFSSSDVIEIQAFINVTDDGPNPVGFYDGETSLGVDTSFPYALSISNLSLGSHSLHVVATNNRYEVDTSLPVSITVSDMALVHSGFTTNGQFAFTVEGVIPGRTNVIESSDDFVDWLPIHTNVSHTTAFVFTDADDALSSRRFYRAKLLP